MVLDDQSLDWQQLHDLSGNDAEFEQELLQMFIEDTEEQLSQLGTAIAEDDPTLSQHIAHHIKGAAANVGAMAIASQAAQLEAIYKQAEHSVKQAEIQQLFEQLKSALSQLRHYLT